MAGPSKSAFRTLWEGPDKWKSENPRTSRQGQEKLLFVHYERAQINESSYFTAWPGNIMFVQYRGAQINEKVRILVLYGRAEKNCFLYITRGPRYRKK
jgi:hypothetical protein